ncbi:hypothetical protein ACI7BZ_11935 [Xanthobacter sp. AM11]|uniref:hypothetical protein n=1 Tax=Xanthobacter sp. AM11 TaxID=3380643 RepID=UPI0039BF4A8C
MSNVIAFPAADTVPVRREAPKRRKPDAPLRTGADIVILPVVRIERHDAPAPGTAQLGAAGRRSR